MSSPARIEIAESRESQLTEQQPFEIMNLGAAAKFLGVSPAEVDRLCQAGTLGAQRSRRGFWIIDAASIVQWREGNPNASASVGESESAGEQRAVPPIELSPCPRGACEAHWQRRRRIVPAFRLDLCRRCFLGHPLPPKAEEEGILDPAQSRVPVASVQAERVVSEKREPVIQEALEKERGTFAVDRPETVSLSAAAQIAGFSPDTVRRSVEQSAIEARRVTSRGWWRIERASLMRFLNRCADGESSLVAARPRA